MARRRAGRLLGGQVAAYDPVTFSRLHNELAGLRESWILERSALGVCLGAQHVASALGASVDPCASKEIGWAPVEECEFYLRMAV